MFFLCINLFSLFSISSRENQSAHCAGLPEILLDPDRLSRLLEGLPSCVPLG